MAKLRITPHERFALDWLEAGGEMWRYVTGEEEALVLRNRSASHRLSVAVIGQLLDRAWIKPVQADRAVTRYELTALGWEQARLARGDEPT